MINDNFEEMLRFRTAVNWSSKRLKVATDDEYERDLDSHDIKQRARAPA